MPVYGGDGGQARSTSSGPQARFGLLIPKTIPHKSVCLLQLICFTLRLKTPAFCFVSAVATVNLLLLNKCTRVYHRVHKTHKIATLNCTYAPGDFLWGLLVCVRVCADFAFDNDQELRPT